MKLFYDLFPILLFFIAYKMYDIFVATAVAIVASFIQVSLFWVKHRQFEKMQLVTLALIIVLGGATLLLHDELFIKWKPTVVNWAFALVFLGSHFIGNRPLIQRMMASKINLTHEKVWHYLNISWIGFFIALGLLNLYVAFNFSTDFWVNFKLFGMMGITFIFVIAQAVYLSQYIKEEDDPATKEV